MAINNSLLLHYFISKYYKKKSFDINVNPFHYIYGSIFKAFNTIANVVGPHVEGRYYVFNY